MAVIFQANGSPVATTTSSLTVPWPAHAVDDIGLLLVTSSAGGTTETLNTANGFTLINTYSTGSGTTGTKLSVYWARATTASMASPVVTGGSDFKYGIIMSFRGAISSGSPIDVTSGGVKASASTSATIPSITTTVADAFYVYAISCDLDSASGFLSSSTNANITNLTARTNGGSANGGGGAIAAASGDFNTPGATGTTTASVTSSINAFLVLALIPAPIVAVTNTFEGGTAGVDLSTANTGGASGTPIVSAPKNAPTTLQFNNVQTRDNLSLLIDYSVSAAGYLVWNWTSNKRSVMRFYVYFEDAMQDTYFEIARFRNSSINTGLIAITSRQFIVYSNSLQHLTPFKLQPNSWYRCELAVKAGTTTSNGRFEFAYYDKDSLTPIYTYDSGTTTDLGTTSFATIRIGAAAGPTPDPMKVYYDDFIVQELASGFIGPSVAGTTYDSTQFLDFF